MVMKVARFLSASILCGVMCCSAVAQSPAAASASIRGAATLGGEPLPGLALLLSRHPLSGLVMPVARTETDAEGKYQFDKLPAGAYFIESLSPHLVPIKAELHGSMTRRIEIAEGETRDNINIELQRGGVITGKIVDSDGYLVIDQSVWYERVDEQGKEISGPQVFNSRVKTDDRGIYRLFGLFPGRFRVYMGERTLQRARRTVDRYDLPLTYYPGTHDVSRARIVEVSAGGEVGGIDIKLSATERTFRVAGRVVDAQTGAPLPWIPLGYRVGNVRPTGEVWTDERGEFRFDGFPPGSYSFFAHPNMITDSEFYSDMTTIEIKDQDVEGVVVNAHRGMTISGWVTFEGAADPLVLKKISALRLAPNLTSHQPNHAPIGSLRRIGPDGRLTFTGLRPGKYWFYIETSNYLQGLTLIRVEHRGVVYEGEIEVAPGKNLSDIRFVISTGSGGLRGRIQKSDEKIELPPAAFMQVSITPSRNRQYIRGASVRADRSGYFSVDGLTPGEYEVRVDLNYDRPPERHGISIGANRQLIFVKQNEMIEVVLPVEIINQGRR
jgi:hypothetical protein